jgi:hypothetical protein
MTTFRHDGAATAGPDADLWVAQDPEIAAIDGFVSRHPHRRAVVIGSPTWKFEAEGDSRARSPRGQISVVPLSAPPSVLRDALGAAIANLATADTTAKEPGVPRS